MKRISIFLFLFATPLLASVVQETAREFSASADFNADGNADVLVLDKTSGIYRIGYGAANGALTFSEGRPAGMGTVTGCAVGKINGVARDSFAATTTTANRANILSPITTGYTEPKAVFDVGIGAKLLAAFDVPGGAGPTAEDDLACLATLDPTMGTQIRTLRSNAGTWTLLNQTDTTETPVEKGNPLVPAASAVPLFAYISDEGTTNTFHAWQLPGGAATEVLTYPSLPDGTEYVAAVSQAPRADVFFYTPGQAVVRSRRIQPAAPWSFGSVVSNTLSEPIAQIVPINSPSGVKLLFRFTSGALALFSYTEAGGFSAPEIITPTGANGVLNGIIAMNGSAFHLLYSATAGGPSTTVVSFKNSGTGWTQSARTPMTAHRPLSATANVLLMANPPFRFPNVPLLTAYRGGDWSSSVSVAGGPLSVNAMIASYGGATQGIGTSSAQSLGITNAPPGGSAVNQQHPQFSLFSFASNLGTAVEDAVIDPPEGTYPNAIKINFVALNAGSSVFYRINGSASFTGWSSTSAPWISSPSTVEYYVRTSSGNTSATKSAQYDFSQTPALQDQDGDGIPDFVEISRGLDPNGGPDSDGDGVSDRDEIAAGTDPKNPASKPTPAAAPNTMLVDVAAKLLDSDPANSATTGTPNAGVALAVYDPYGNPVGLGSIGTGGAPAGFGRVTAAGIAPELEYLVVRTPEHFDVTPDNGNSRHGREMIAVVPVTPAEAWSFALTNTSGIEIATPWSWGGTNWLTGSTNWDLGLGETETFDPGWSAMQLSAEWGTTPVFSATAWQTLFQSAVNSGVQPYVKVTLSPLTSMSALITGKILGTQLALRSGTTVDGTSLAFAPTLAPVFESFRSPDPAHLTAPAFRVQALLASVDQSLNSSDAGSNALRKIARSVYARHQLLLPANLTTLPMPLVALATFLKTGALPLQYDLAGTGLTTADLAAANARLTVISAAPLTRTVTQFFLTTRATPNPAGLVLAQSSTTIYALFDANLQPFAFPENLPAGTPLVVKAYTDLPMVGGYSTLEVISMEVASLPYLVGSDSDDDLLADVWELRHIGSLDSGALTNLDGSAYSLLQEYYEGTNPLLSGNSPLVAPVAMRLTDLTIFLTGTPRLSVRWPARYASAITVSFDTSSTLSSWTNDPTFSALYTGSGLFTRNITLTGSKFFYRARAHSKP